MNLLIIIIFIYFSVIKGYVDSVDGSRSVIVRETQLPTDFTSFIINNGDDRRVRILIWGPLVKKYETKIHAMLVSNI